MAQYSHPYPYSGPTLPQLGLGGQSRAPATQGDSIAAPKQPEIRPKQKSSFLHNSQIFGLYEELRAQYSYSQPYSGLILPKLGLGGHSPASATQGDPSVAHKQPEITQH